MSISTKILELEVLIFAPQSTKHNQCPETFVDLCYSYIRGNYEEGVGEAMRNPTTFDFMPLGASPVCFKNMIYQAPRL